MEIINYTEDAKNKLRLVRNKIRFSQAYNHETRNSWYLATILEPSIVQTINEKKILEEKQEDKLREIADFLLYNRDITDDKFNKFVEELKEVGLNWIPSMFD